MKPLEPSLQGAFDDLRADFRAGKTSRFTPRLTGVAPLGSGADYHYRYERDFLHMIERARSYERDDMLVRPGIDRLTANVVQDGFKPDPQTGSANLNSYLKDKWAEWAEEPDYCHSEGEFTFYQQERLAFRSIIRDGDIFILPQKSGSLQSVEAHRARTPSNTKRNVVHGILMENGSAVRSQVWFSKEDLGTSGSLQKVSDVKPYDIRDKDGNRQVLQLYFPRRFSQRRGVTALAPCSDTIGQHDDLQFATLVKAQLASLIVLLEEQGLQGFSGTGPGLSSAPGSQPTASEASAIPGVGAGIHYKLKPGNKMSGFSPNIPNPEFFPHAMMLLTFIAINLDLPVCVLLLDPSNTNFSGWRGAIDQARLRYREMQRDFRDQFHRPVYKWKVRNWLETDPVAQRYASEPGVTPFKHLWQFPTWPYIEPYKDSQADDLQQTKFLNSPRRIQGARGRDWDEVAVEIVEDKSKLISLAIEKAAEINKIHPEANLTWRDLLGEGLNAAPAAYTNPIADTQPTNKP
jgi:capsid protein